MRDVEIKKLFNIPHSTLYKFKIREKGDWRRNVYDFLRAITKEEAEEILKRINIKK
jgi:predicted transcriptional regulator